MIIRDKDVYSEVNSILNLLGNEFIEKIPEDIYKMILEKRNKEYNPNYSLALPLEKQNINKKSLSVIALFDVNYWSDLERGSYLKKVFKENEIKNQNKLREKYNPDNIFKDNKIKDVNEKDRENNITKYKESILKRVLSKIKNIIRKK